jgi:hypothetical protein
VALAGTLTVSAEEFVVDGDGLKLAVIPAGAFCSANVTPSVKFVRVMITVALPVEPALTKICVGVTVRV